MLKQIFHLKKQDHIDATEQVLSLRIGNNHCSFAITDKSGVQLFELGYYTHEVTAINPTAELFTKHTQLNQDFHKVLASYDYPQSALVPDEFFKKDEAPVLLNSLYAINNANCIVSEPVKGWDLYNVYAVPREMHEWMKNKFSAGNYWHQYTIGIHHIRPNDTDGHLLVDLRANDFTIIAAKGNTLLLAQTFSYSTPADVLYYLLKTCQEYELSQKQVLLSLSGLIEKDSALYKDLYQYFIHINFRKSSWETDEEEYPRHFFTSLNDLAICAS